MVTRGDKGTQILDILWVVLDEKVTQACVGDLFRTVESVHSRHRVIALGKEAMSVKEFDLIVFREVNGDGSIQLTAPDTL